MESKARKTLTGFIVFLMIVGLAAATGILSSQSGSIVLQSQDGRVLPDGSGVMDLGSSDSGWKDGYFKGSVFVGGADVNPVAFNVNGSVGIPYNAYLYGNTRDPANRNSIKMYDGGTGDMIFNIDTPVASNFVFGSSNSGSGSVVPASDGGYSLGVSGRRWGGVYANSLTTYGSTVLSNGNYAPNSVKVGDAGYSFGAMGNRFVINTPSSADGYNGVTINIGGSTKYELTSNELRTNVQSIRPVANNANTLGTQSYAWSRVYAYGYTTKSSRDYVKDFKGKYGESAVDMINGISVDANGKWKHETIPVAYKIGDFWEVTKKRSDKKPTEGAYPESGGPSSFNESEVVLYKTLDEVPEEDKPLAEHHSLIDMNARDDTLEAAIRELSAENQLIKQELCKQSQKYSFCQGKVRQ